MSKRNILCKPQPASANPNPSQAKVSSALPWALDIARAVGRSTEKETYVGLMGIVENRQCASDAQLLGVQGVVGHRTGFGVSVAVSIDYGLPILRRPGHYFGITNL